MDKKDEASPDKREKTQEKQKILEILKNFFTSSKLEQLEKSYEQKIIIVKKIMYDFYDLTTELKSLIPSKPSCLSNDNSPTHSTHSNSNFKKINPLKYQGRFSKSKLNDDEEKENRKNQRSTSVDRGMKKERKDRNFYLPKVTIDIEKEKEEKKKALSKRRSDINEYSKKIYANFLIKNKSQSRTSSITPSPRNYRLEPKKRNYSISNLHLQDEEDEMYLGNNRMSTQNSQSTSMIFSKVNGLNCNKSFKKKNNLNKVFKNEKIMNNIFSFLNHKANPLININKITRTLYIENCLKVVQDKIKNIKDDHLSSIMQKEVLTHVEGKLNIMLNETKNNNIIT